MKSGLKKLSGIFLLLFSFLILSCDFDTLFGPSYDDPVKDFFKEYTETAAIEKLTLPSGTENRAGILCVPAENDSTASFYMRNPQGYTLDFGFAFDEDAVQAAAADTGFSFTQSDDKNGGTLTFSKNFLYSVDSGSIGGKDISGSITLTEPKSGRNFASYPITLHANTPPPSVQGAAFQRSSADDSATYIVCFFMPDTSQACMALHANDTHVLYVNGEKRYMKQGLLYASGTQKEDGGWEISEEDGSFTNAEPSLFSLTDDDSAFSFDPENCPDGYTPVYYLTNWPVSTDTRTCTFIVEDDEGLSSSISVSNKASKLDAPSLSVESDTTYPVDDETFLFTLTMSHDGKCTDGSSCGTATINYTVTEKNGALVFAGGKSSTLTGSSEGSASVSLPKGVYEISAYASKDYFISSDTVRVTNVKTIKPSVYYISEDGTDSDAVSGSAEKPYRSIQYAINKFKTGIENGDYDEDAICDIHLLSDITPADGFDWSSNGGCLVDTAGLESATVNITGDGSRRTVDAQGGVASVRALLNAAAKKMTVSDVRFTGGYTEDSAAINVVGELVMENVTVSGNTGRGILNSGKLTLDGCTVSGNTMDSAEENGAGICMQSLSVLVLRGVNYIYDNYNDGGEAQKRDDVFLPAGGKITVDGDISGSTIGVNVPWSASDAGVPAIGSPAAFTSGYGYGSANTALPGDVFVAENGYSVAADDSGEAAFVVSGGEMYNAMDFKVTLSADAATVSLNTAKTVTVKVSGTRSGEQIFFNNADNHFYTDSAFAEDAAGGAVVSLGAALYSNGTKICDCAVAAAPDSGSVLVTVPAVEFEENYTLRVTAAFLGVTVDMNLTLGIE